MEQNEMTIPRNSDWVLDGWNVYFDDEFPQAALVTDLNFPARVIRAKVKNAPQPKPLRKQ